MNEIDSGYFQREITSQTRSGLTTAGTNLGASLSGSITRTTGSSYNKDSGEGRNFKRYYEVNNIGDELNSTIIPAQAQTPTSGAFYTFTDSSGLYLSA